MRVTNKMIMNNAASNINTTKECVNTRNKQMTSQKKIDRPSDDPVVAVRSLRLSTTLSQVTQYYKKNIPDATSWLDVTETSLINIRDIMKDCRDLAVTGSTDTYNQDDRNTMITQLESLQKQIFAEGNADYANRTVFTGYRTNCNLTFTEDELETKYRITQSLTIEDNMEEHRYYAGVIDAPSTESDIANVAAIAEDKQIEQTNYYRLRLNYADLDSINSLTVSYENGTSYTFSYESEIDSETGEETYINTENVGTDPDIVTRPKAVSGGGFTLYTFENETEWMEASLPYDTSSDDDITKKAGKKTVPDDAIIIIKETGDIILGDTVASTFKTNKASIEAEYDKTGFDEGELRPEYYYNCTKMEDPKDVNVPVEYYKYDKNTGDLLHFDIQYTIAANQTITINTEASDVFNSDIQRDIAEMIDAVKKTINAHNKLDTIDKMMGEVQFQSDEDQEYLSQWREAIKKEADYFDDNMQKLFDTELGKIDTYYAKISLGITDLGCKVDSLKLTETRVGDQRETVQDLQSNNDDLDLSQIIIDYTAAYTAYQASLTAAGKLSESTLLNYI